MKKLLLIGGAAAMLAASASVGFAGPSSGGTALGNACASERVVTYGRRQAMQRRLVARPYSLTGTDWKWETNTRRNPSGRYLGTSFKRVLDKNRSN